ncbi:MAG: hypothetical protein U1E65_09660 [Myxococcota bacterium]
MQPQGRRPRGLRGIRHRRDPPTVVLDPDAKLVLARAETLAIHESQDPPTVIDERLAAGLAPSPQRAPAPRPPPASESTRPTVRVSPDPALGIAVVLVFLIAFGLSFLLSST